MGDKKFDIHELIEKGKQKGTLSQSEILEALDDEEFDICLCLIIGSFFNKLLDNLELVFFTFNIKRSKG